MNTPFDEDPLPPRKPRRFAALRASFLTGIVVIAPVALTVWLVWAIIGWVDSVVLPLVPYNLRPEKYIGINLRGVGVIIFLIFTIVVGWIAKGLIGRSMISFAGITGRTDAGGAHDLFGRETDCRDGVCPVRAQL